MRLRENLELVLANEPQPGASKYPTGRRLIALA
jgi:hypothetical protein